MIVTIVDAHWFSQVIDEYQKSFGETWRTVQADGTQPWPYLTEALTKFQVFISPFYIWLFT